MATIERENALRLFEQIINVASSQIGGPDKQKLVKLLEEVSTPGLKEKRVEDSRTENAALLDFTKKTFKVSNRGGTLVGGWVDKKAPGKPTGKPSAAS